MIEVHTHKNITELVLARASARNALTLEMIQDLHEKFKTIGQDETCAVIVLRAQGDHFCAGADLHWMKDSAKLTPAQNAGEAKELYDLLYTMLMCPKPIVCLVKGSVYGGGVGLVAASDFAFADETAKFCLSEVKLGLTPSMISPFVVQKMGYAQFKICALRANIFEAKEAQGLGLISSAVLSEDLESAKSELVSQLNQNAPFAMAEVKRLTQFLYEQHHWNIFANELPKHIASVRSGAEAQEGLQCFFDRTRPSWSRA